MGRKSEKSRGLSMSKRNELKILSDAILVKSREKLKDNNEIENFNEIYNLLERIIKIESEVKLPFKTLRTEKSIESFIGWCEQEGANLENIELKNYQEYGLGLVAKKKLAEGDIFIEIPEKMIFSFSKIENSIPEVLKQKVFMDCPLFENKSNVRLALALMIECMNSQSRFKPYFDVLPRKFSTVLYFSPADMKELQAATACAAIKQVIFIASQYAFLYKYLMISANGNDPVIQELRDNFTYEFYRWAVSCVMTRQNIIPKDNGSNESVLIPAWDMANHTNGDINTQFNIETKKIESFCIKNFEIGEQVTIAYGNRSNLDFLIHNGFVFKENTNNEILIKVNLNKTDSLYEDRVTLFKIIGLNDSGYFKVYPEYSAELLGFFRVFNMTKDQLDSWILSNDQNVQKLLTPKLVLEKSLESKVLQSLLIRIKILLKLFPTNINEDLALLRIGNLSKIKTMLIQYRILERDALVLAETKIANEIKEFIN